MNKFQSDLIEAQKARTDRAMAAVDAAADRLVLEAVRCRAMYDAVEGLEPDPRGATKLAHEATAEYLRRTAAEHDAAAEA